MHVPDSIQKIARQVIAFSVHGAQLPCCTNAPPKQVGQSMKKPGTPNDVPGQFIQISGRNLKELSERVLRKRSERKPLHKA